MRRYTTQSANGRFHSPYDDHAYGASAESGVDLPAQHDQGRGVLPHGRAPRTADEQADAPDAASTEPLQEQSQDTWSLALEDTLHASSTVDVVGGISYDRYDVTRAEDFTAARGVFEYPKGGADAFNWQAAVVWRYTRRQRKCTRACRTGRAFRCCSSCTAPASAWRHRIPILDPSGRPTSSSDGKGGRLRGFRLEGTVFYSDVRDLIQTVLLADNTTQTQNVGDGRFYGAEFAVDAPVTPELSVGGNYTALSRTIRDALQPNLRPTGAPTHKAFLYAAWRPVASLTITPSLDIAGDRWSDVNTTPVPSFPYLRTGGYALLDISAQYTVQRNFDVVFGLKNLADRNYELAWGFPQPGRTFYVKTRVGL